MKHSSGSCATTRHIVWIDATSWGGVPGTGRPLVIAMTRHASVLWVDRPVSPLTSSGRRADVSHRFAPALASVGHRVTRLSPVALPGFSRPGIRATTTSLVGAQLRWALRRTGMTPCAVVTTQLEVLPGRQDGAVSVLYATDDYVAGAGLMGLSADWLRARERRALDQADLVVVASPQLAEHWSELGADPVLIPNGCSPPDPAGAVLAPVQLDLPRPVVGLVGHLSGRIDLRLLDSIADAGLSLLLVGPHDPRWEPARFAALTARPEVRHVGAVTAERARAYMAAVDVGITPYADSPFNRASFPLKTLEYLSAGRPVVSTGIPAARWLRDDLAGFCQHGADQVLVLADGPAEFVSAVRRVVAFRQPPGRAGGGAADLCSAFAARHSWQRRADALAAAIGI